jgi:hypothetical protein
MDSLFTIAIILGVAVAGAAALYLFARRQGGDSPERRLGYIERASIDGGRKLVLIRRDNVEHLLLIGGPIDLVIETGIPSEPQAGRHKAAENAFAGAVQSYAETARNWQLAATNGSAEPSLSLNANGKADGEGAPDLTPAQESKLAK